MKKITPKNRNTVLSILLFLLTKFAFSQVTIKSQSFDGSPSDNLGYTLSDTDIVVSPTTFVSSPNSLEIKGKGTTTRNIWFSSIDITNYSNVTLSIAFASAGVDDDEDLFLEFSTNNGVTYPTQVKLIDGNNSGGGQNLSFGTGDSSPGQTINPYIYNVPASLTALMFRLRSVGVDTGESFYIDNIIVSGTQQPEINLQGGSPLATILTGSTTINTTINTDFGTTDIYSGLVSKTYTIQNLGTGDLSILSTSSSISDFTVTSSTGTIPAGSTGTITVTFDPLTVGTKNGVITIGNNDPNEASYTFAVRGTGTNAEIDLQGNATSIVNGDSTPILADWTEFGEMDVTTGTIARTFTIRNNGTINLTIANPTISGVDAADFSITTNPSGTTINAASNRTFVVTFNPSAIGVRNAVITITNDDFDENPYTFSISGTGTNAEMNVIGNSTSINDNDTSPVTTDNTDFATTDLTLGTITKTFTIENTGTTNLIISNPTLSGTNASDFSITNPALLTIPAGGNITFDVTFNPSAIGLRTATISITNNDSNENPYNFSIQGTGTNVEIDLQGNATSIVNGDSTPILADWSEFGSMDVTTGTIARTFTIRNTGTTTLTIANPTISGVDAADFSITTNPSGTTINAASNRTFIVTFNPSATGVRNAIITITNDDFNENPYTFSISGTGTNAEIELTGNAINIVDGATTPSTIDATDFGSTDLTLGTITTTYTIINTGTTVLILSNPVISGTNASDFTVTTNPGTLIIPVGSSTTFVVTFNPSGNGVRTATISITNNDGGTKNPFNFSIQGTGTNREINLLGNSISISNNDTFPSITDWTSFGSLDITSGILTRTYTIENTGTTTLTIANPTISGVDAADFSITTNPSGTTINAASNRTFVVTFNPSAIGIKTAIITIPNNDFNESPYTFTIEGNGTNSEVNVTGLGTTIENGDTTATIIDGTSFGNVIISLGTSTRTYVIQNNGTTSLTISNPTISGINPTDFTITSNPSILVIPAGGNTSFTVSFSTSFIGQRNAFISFNNDDVNESPYIFFINGFGDIDTDGDTVSNNIDRDDDNDGITDEIECNTCLSDPFQNGNFENPTIAAGSYAILPTRSVTGWQTSAENFIEIWSSGFNGVPAATGNQFAELNANIPGILYQTFCLNGAGGTINWSIKHRGRSGIDQAFVKFGDNLVNAVASIPIVTMVDGNSAWGTYSGIYTIPLGQTQIVMTFQAGYTDSGSGSASVGNFIDDVQIVINQNCIDNDGDGVADVYDVDDENDGIPDIEEAGFKAYSNKKSTMDMSSASTWTDTNGNGMNDYIDSLITAGSYAMINTDSDSRSDYLDLDSDNDSLFDVDEAGLLNGDGDINGDGKGDLVDTDRDGLLDLYDNATSFGTINRNYTIDTDNDGIADYKELDNDNNGTFDISNTLYSNLDTNNDGKIDDLIDTDNDADRDGILDFFDTNIAYFGSPRDLNRKLFLDFDGRNDYGQATAVLGGLANASMMAWINLKSGYNTTGVVVGQNRFQIRVTSAKRLDVTVNSTTLSYGVSLSETRWYHVAATYNGTTLKLFLNGVEVNSVATSGNIGADASPLTIGKNPSSSTNYFTGKIDEVRIFNVALTNQQLQRMVYQEIQNTASQVRGAIVPKDIEALPFANVLRYYRMDVYKDDIIDDLTTPAVDLGTGMKIFNHKNIKVQQAPMPFVTQQAGDFATAVNSVTNEIYGMDIMNNDYSIVQVKHNISESFNITNLGMFVDPSVTITINNDNKIQNDWYLKLDGKIDLQGRSQLVQTVNSELDVTSAGYIERDQQGQSNKFNYNYWSSPVGTLSTSSNNNSYTVNGVMKDGTIPTSIQNINWIGGYNGAATSPISVSNYWIFKFQNVTPVYANWSSVGPNGTLLAAQGYTMKGTDALTSTQNYTFVGKPNNGTISTPIAGGNLNLSGNPYASAIDCDTFITDNNTSITGTLYFWEHFSTNTSHNLLEYQGGYATRNLVGGTPPVSPAGISGLGSSTRTPKRFIPVGQGFFVTGSATGGNIIFNNSQRLFIKENNASSNVLFRHDISGPISSNPMNNNEDSFVENTFAKIRLGFNSATNYHRQILIGFMNENATSAIDPGYDAVNIDNQPNDMYFMNSNNKLIIQGEGFFNTDNIYPIGIKSGAVGNVNFTLDEIENFDASQDIFIYDNQTNLYHNIRNQAFEIELPIGTVLDRFSLRFKDATPLATTDFNLSSQIIVAFTSNDNTINIRNNALNTTIKKVELYNILGQSIRQWDVKDYDQAKIKIPVKNISTGTYIVKILTSNGDISKKIIIN